MFLQEKDKRHKKIEDEISMDYCNHRFDKTMPQNAGSNLEDTFKHMYEILQTNHLTHELSAQDLEMLEFIDDLPIASVSPMQRFKVFKS